MAKEKDRFFQVGGTLSADAPSYIERPADEKLLALVEDNELCLVLAPRQMGKSSLMVRASDRLGRMGIRVGMVDLQGVGKAADLQSEQRAAQWFSNVLYQIERGLGLETDAFDWWESQPALMGPTSRFMKFLEDVVLKETPGRLAIFFDEIDSALHLPFSDDFFTAIRALYNARAHNPELRRLSFVLLGVATPSEFIRDRSRTPFNIGREITLTDFDPADLGRFREKLGDGADAVVERIFYWTSGQPLMAQRLAAAASSWPAAERTPERVDAAAGEYYLDAEIEKERHLQFVRDYLLADKGELRKTLSTYLRMLKGKPVALDERSSVHARLLLAGVARVVDGKLVARNRIYRRVFNEKWVRGVRPRNVWKVVALGATAALALVLIWFYGVKPYFFPAFIRSQSYSWFQEEIHYTAEDHLFLPIALPKGSFRKMTMNGQPLQLSEGIAEKGPSAGDFHLPFANLKIGANTFKIRYYGKWREDSYETNIVIVYYPKEQWQAPDLEFVDVPAGCFTMGCGGEGEPCEDDEKPAHRVCITSGFGLGRYEVTQKQWEQVMGHNPSYFKACGEDCPVEWVSWQDARLFIDRLNAMEGRAIYRMPTEAEWEYAARAGSITAFANGKITEEKCGLDPNLDAMGWYCGNSAVTYQGCYDLTKRDGPKCAGTHPVGGKLPNEWGLHDMHGNVYEWCRDWYESDYYAKSTENDPQGPDTGDYRVLRGGSWHYYAVYCRSAYRSWNDPAFRHFSVGFRLLRSLP